MNLAHLVRARVRLDLREGDFDSALRRTRQILEFGRRVAGCESFGDSIVSVIVQIWGLAELRRVVEQGTLGSDVCRELVGDLEAYEFDRRRVDRLWAAGYRDAVQTLEESPWLGDSRFYLRNRTLQRVVTIYRAERAWMKETQWTAPPFPESREAFVPPTPSNWFNSDGEHVYFTELVSGGWWVDP